MDDLNAFDEHWNANTSNNEQMFEIYQDDADFQEGIEDRLNVSGVEGSIRSQKKRKLEESFSQMLDERREELLDLHQLVEHLKHELDGTKRENELLRKNVVMEKDFREKAETHAQELKASKAELEIQNNLYAQKLVEHEQALEISKKQYDEAIKADGKKHESTEHVHKLQFEQKLAIAQDRISQLENNNKELQLSLDKIRIEKNFAENESREYKEKITRLLTLVSTHTKENESIRQQYDESQTKVRELQQKLGHITVLEQQKHELEDKIKKLETEVTQNKNKDTELKKITLELDIAYAENEGLKDRARRFETVHQDLVRITSDLDKANYSLREWNLAFPLKQAHDIATSLKKLEMENKSMIELNNTLRDELTKLQKVHASVTQTSHEANALSEKLKTQLDEERKLSEVLRKETMILRTELESRKRMIESFEKQLAVETGNATNDTIRELENALRERNSQIESLTRDYSQLTASLGRKDSEIESKENVIARLTKDVTVLESEKQQLQNAMDPLNKRIEDLEKQLSEHDHRMGRGDVNWDKFKVLHMAINPETQARAKGNNELESIRAENKILSTRIEDLQRRLNSVNTQEDVNELKKQHADGEVRYARLKEVFHKKIHDFRRVVYLLFGFRVDMENNNRYKLSSMYAETPDDFLYFSFNDKMEFVLHETDFTASLDTRVTDYLTKYRSIPAFVSTLTMDLFRNQTIFAAIQ